MGVTIGWDVKSRIGQLECTVCALLRKNSVQRRNIIIVRQEHFFFGTLPEPDFDSINSICQLRPPLHTHFRSAPSHYPRNAVKELLRWLYLNLAPPNVWNPGVIPKRTECSCAFCLCVRVNHLNRCKTSTRFSCRGAVHDWQTLPNEDTVSSWWYRAWSALRTCIQFYFLVMGTG